MSATQYLDFIVLFAEPDEAEAFVDDCVELEYQAEVGEYDGDDDRYRWVVTVTRQVEPGTPSMTALELTLRSFASKRDGRYVGWA